MATGKEVGRGLDGSVRFTLGVIIGLLFIIIGTVIIFYVGSFVFGIPVLLLGLLLPIFLQLVLGKKRS